MKTYEVISPSYPAVEDYVVGYAIYVDARDWLLVRAEDVRHARIVGVTAMLRAYKDGWCAQRRTEGLNPYVGLQVNEVPYSWWRRR